MKTYPPHCSPSQQIYQYYAIHRFHAAQRSPRAGGLEQTPSGAVVVENENGIVHFISRKVSCSDKRLSISSRPIPETDGQRTQVYCMTKKALNEQNIASRNTKQPHYLTLNRGSMKMAYTSTLTSTSRPTGKCFCPHCYTEVQLSNDSAT